MKDAQNLCHNFEAAALEAFDTLCTGTGFLCVESQPDRVRYESPSVHFEVGYTVDHDREVYARIGRVGFPGVLPGGHTEWLDLGLLLSVANPAGYAELRRVVPYAIAISVKQVRWVLNYLAAGLGLHGLPLLAGESNAYERARDVRFWHAPEFPPESLVTQTRMS